MRVFISHAQPDSGWARCLARELEARGIDVWLDVERLEPGQHWDEAIRKAVDAADACLVLVSHASDPSEALLSKEWVAIQEQSWARPDLWVYPVQLGSANLPPFLRKWQALRVPEPDCEHVEAAADRIFTALTLGPPKQGKADAARERSAAAARFAKLERMLAELNAAERETPEHDG